MLGPVLFGEDPLTSLSARDWITDCDLTPLWGGGDERPQSALQVRDVGPDGGRGIFRGVGAPGLECPRWPKVRRTHGGRDQGSAVPGAAGAPRAAADPRPASGPTRAATRRRPPARSSGRPPRGG